jgi:hypothetical protein
MAIKAADILVEASLVLQDEGFVRWTPPELARWLNEAQRAIVLAKPSASPETVVLQLVEGTRQVLSDENHLLLLRIVRNLRGSAPPYLGGRIIRPTTRETLDGSQPNWHDKRDVPYSDEVRQYVYDEANPREFYVYPGNTGLGKIEAVVSKLPAMIATSGTTIDQYASDIGLPEPYRPVILDYVLYRALEKEDIAADVTRARLHYQSFATALGLKAQSEKLSSPNTGAGVQRT